MCYVKLREAHRPFTPDDSRAWVKGGQARAVIGCLLDMERCSLEQTIAVVLEGVTGP